MGHSPLLIKGLPRKEYYRRYFSENGHKYKDRKYKQQKYVKRRNKRHPAGLWPREMQPAERELYEKWRKLNPAGVFSPEWIPPVVVRPEPLTRAEIEEINLAKRRASGVLRRGEKVRIKNLAKKTYVDEGVDSAERRHGHWWSSYANSLPDPTPDPEWVNACEGNPLPFLWLLIEAERQKKQKAKRAWKKKSRKTPGTRTYIVERIRKRMAKAIKEGRGMKSGTSREIIGCDWGALRAHLEAGFTERMSWSNYGQYGWHIDHIEPLARFDMRDPAQVRKAWHFTNLQPLWWTDNLDKLDSFKFERIPVGCVQNITS
jgi:hypothetical protein